MHIYAELDKARSEFTQKMGRAPNYLIIGGYTHHRLKLTPEYASSKREHNDRVPDMIFGIKYTVDITIRDFKFAFVLEDD